MFTGEEPEASNHFDLPLSLYQRSSFLHSSIPRQRSTFTLAGTMLGTGMHSNRQGTVPLLMVLLCQEKIGIKQLITHCVFSLHCDVNRSNEEIKLCGALEEKRSVS